MTRLRLTTVLLGAAMLTACSKDGVQIITAPATGAFIKFFNFGVNSPGVNFYANSTKVTAISATTCTPPTDPRCTTTGLETVTGTTYTNAGNAGLYSALASGSYTFAGEIAAATDNGLAVSKVATSLTDGKHYSYFQSGIYNATAKTSEAFIIEDAFPAQIDYVNAYVRFVNASSNSSPMVLYAKNTVTGDSLAIGSAVAYQAGGAFVVVPTAFYNLTTRVTGSNTAAISRAGVSFSPGRVYTVTARGDITTASTVGLDNTANR